MPAACHAAFRYATYAAVCHITPYLMPLRERCFRRHFRHFRCYAIITPAIFIFRFSLFSPFALFSPCHAFFLYAMLLDMLRLRHVTQRHYFAISQATLML